MQKPSQLTASVLAKVKSLALLFCVLVLFFTGVFTYTRADTDTRVYAAPSSTINFQARLLTAAGAVVPDGFYNIQYKLYDGGTQGGPAGTGEANAGSLVWTETRDYAGTDDRVRVVNGYFSVTLGSVASFPGSINWDQEHWLTMSVRGNAQCDFATTCTPADAEMLAPGNKRTKLTAVPYAFSAGQLISTNNNNRGVLGFDTLTSARSILLPDQDGTLCIQGSADCVDVATTGTTATTSSNSGLETDASGLRLLGGCSDSQFLRWNDTTDVWECASGSGASLDVSESDGSPSLTTSALEFGPDTNSSDEFIITDEGGGLTRIRIGSSILSTGNYASTLDNVYVNENQSPAAGDVSGSFTAGLSVNDVQNNAVDLGAETVGDYVQNLGTLVGLSTSGNSGEGSTPGLSVLYGSSANTAVQGNTQLTCPSGSGDLSGGGTVITLGTGGTCGAITISEAPVFDTSVTTPLITYGGALTVQTTATAGADDLIFKTAGTEVMRLLENGNIYLEKGTNDVTIAVNAPGAAATYTFDGATGTVLTSANYSTNLDATYVNTGESPAAGDVSGSFTAGLSVNDVQNNAVDLGAETVGDYVQNLGTLVGLSTSGNSGEGSTPGLSVLYGSSANTAVQGNTQLTCPSGSGDLSGGGTVITLGTGGTCGAITISEAPVFDTSVTTPLITYGGALTVQTTATAGADDLIFKTAGTEVMRLLENGNIYLEKGTNDVTIAVNAPGAAATYTFDGATGTVLTSANYSTNLDATYVNTGESPAAGDVSGSFTAGLSVNDVQNNAVDLGAETVGDYVQNLGTLVGLSTSGNSGEGSTPGLSVLYGSSANTAVQGNTQLTCPSGSGDLSGGGTVITLGTGGTCGAITISEAPVFDTSVTTPLITYGGALTVQTTATAGADDLIFKTAGTEVMRLLENGNIYLEKGTNDVTIAVNAPGAAATYTFDGATGTVLTSANYSTNLDATYVNTGESPAAGDVSGSFTAGLSVNDVQNNAVDLGAETVGDYVQNLGTLVGLSTSGNSGEGSTPGLSVLYGSGANNAAAGANTFTCTSGSGNLTGGGTVVTIGTSGTTCAAITTNDAVSFATSVTTPLLTNAGLLTIQTSATGGADDIVFQTAGTEKIRILENGQLVFGTGANSANLYLSANDTLKTDDLFVAGSGLTILTGNLNVVAGDIQTNSVTRIENDGDLVNIGNLTAAAALIIANAGAGNDITINSIDQIIINSGTTIELQDNTNITGTLDVSSAINAGNGNAFNVNADGDITSAFTLLDGSSTTNGAAVIASTSMVLTDASAFNVGNYVKLDNNGGNCSGTVTICYAKITAKATNTLTITPALTWTTGRTVTEVHIPEIGGTNLAQTLENRYGRGYFISGVATGNGTTYYNENSIETSLTSFDLLNTAVATLNIGGAATTLNLGSSGTAVNLTGILSGLTGLTVSSGGATITGDLSLDGTIADTNSDLVLNDQLNLGSSTTGLLVTTDGVITDLDDTSITFGENLTVSAGGVTVTGNSSITGTLTGLTGLTIASGGASITGGIDNNSGGITEAGAIAGASTIDASGLITSVGLTAGGGLIQGTGGLTIAGAISLDGALSDPNSNLVLDDIVELGSASSGLRVAVSGALIDIDGNVVLDDIVDIGSATTGLRVAADGSFLDIDGALVLNDELNLGSATTGLLVTIDGVITDLDDASISFGENITVSAGGITVTGDSTIAGSLGSITTLNASGLVTSVGLNAGSGLIQGTGGLTIVGAVSLDGAISDPNSNLVLDDTVDIGSAANGIRVATDGSILDINGDLVLNDQLALGSSSTGLLITTDGGITDVDDASITFGENVTVSAGGLTVTGGIDNNTGGITEAGSITGVGANITGSGAVTFATGAAGALVLESDTTGAITIGGDASAETINISTGGAVKTLTIGSTNGASITTLQAGTGGLAIGSGGIANTIQIGNTTGAVAQTINIGTNATASSDTTVTIGSTIGTSTTSIRGDSASTFVINAITVDATEFNRLDGKTAALVDQDDFITTDGAGATINGSGLEAGTGGIGLLQGCANNEILKWVDASSRWNCAADATGISDSRVKKNVATVEKDMLDRIKDIRVVEFDFDCSSPAFYTTHCDIDHQTGVIAQEIAQIFPELVTEVNGYYRVRYDALAMYNLKAVSEIARSIDSNRNGNFSNARVDNSLIVNGVLEAGTIRADHIEGLDYIGRFESLEARVNALESEPTSPEPSGSTQQNIDLENLTVGKLTATGAVVFKEEVAFEKNANFAADATIAGSTTVQSLTVNLDLVARGSIEAIGPATFKEAVRFEKDVQFDGQINALGYTNLQGLTVNLDLIVKGALEVQGPTTFREAVRFEKDTTFEGKVAVKGQATFNNDTAGYATVKKDELTIEVKFKSPKERRPIITLTLGEGKFAQYSYRNVTEEGFEIVLSRPADEDLIFSWVAILTEEEVSVVQ